MQVATQPNQHTLILGGVGAGKLAKVFIPSITDAAQIGNSAILYEICETPGQTRFQKAIETYQRRGHKVQRFTPFEADTVRLQLLPSLCSLGDAQGFANVIIPTTPDSNYYKKLEQVVLTALIYLASFEPAPSLAWVHEQLQQGPAHLKNLSDGADLNILLEKAFRQPEKQTALVKSLAQTLEVFSNPNVRRATTGNAEDGFDFQQLYSKPGLFHFSMTFLQSEREAGMVLARLLEHNYLQRLYEVGARHQGIIPVTTCVWIPELERWGKLNHLHETLATTRSRHLYYKLGLQSEIQAKYLYGHDWEPMKDNNIREIINLD